MHSVFTVWIESLYRQLGHSPSSVHEQALYVQAESEVEAQLLADHAHNPLIQDIRWITKWRKATCEN